MYDSDISPAYVTFTVRGIVGTEARTFRDWVTHSTPKVPWKIGKC